jgi:hypothetical protein
MYLFAMKRYGLYSHNSLIIISTIDHSLLTTHHLLLKSRPLFLPGAAHGNNAIHNVVGVASPREFAIVLLVVQHKVLTAIHLQLFGYAVFRHAEFEGGALHGAGGGALQAGLYQGAFPGFENVAFVFDFVKVSILYPIIAKWYIETPIQYDTHNQDNDKRSDNGEFSHN